jgi:hypothetical protein
MKQIKVDFEEFPIIMAKIMGQLYSRVFLQILDSSIAEDFNLRHVFEDFLKLAEYKTGVVDMTREAISRRTNIPLDILSPIIDRLEAPDPKSRDQEHEGRRIERLDKHRDWGWSILNWEKYDKLRTQADVNMRVQRHRDKNPPSGFKRPSLEEIKLHFSQAGMTMDEADKFFNYYESNGWKVGRNPMKSWVSAAANWRKNVEDRHDKKPSASAELIKNQRALERVEDRLQYLKGQMPLIPKLKSEWNELKEEQTKLKKILGFKA